jgi:hypothetical protein
VASISRAVAGDSRAAIAAGSARQRRRARRSQRTSRTTRTACSIVHSIQAAPSNADVADTITGSRTSGSGHPVLAPGNSGAAVGAVGAGIRAMTRDPSEGTNGRTRIATNVVQHTA